MPSRVSDPASARLFGRPFSGVADRLLTWEKRGYLVHEPTAALQLHEYTTNGVTIRGLVGALDVSRRASGHEDRAIHPHEGIYPAQADDLAGRMHQMGLNPAPILLVQTSPVALRDLLAAVRDTPPPVTFVDRAGHTHRIWPIEDPELLEAIAGHLAPTTAVIADGHHRYAAYLRLQQRHPGGGFDRGLAMIVDQGDTPLFLGAIHRVLHGSSLDDVASAAATVGIPTRLVRQPHAMACLAPGTMVATDQARWLTLELGERADTLEIEALHDRIVPALAHGPHRVTHHHSAAEALGLAGTESGTAVLLPAPRFEQIENVVRDGRLFPEKATSFQPKPPLGVMLRFVHDEDDEPTSPRPRPAIRSRLPF
ncbi:DUF1015 family protein [Nocardioides sp.]|uniref:DUF1015 family protein n=1 Tax=Nocardioides sp. TaxID=35761 RepID=UPI002B2739BE|nr:DUF1015 family protein [Nocardioides sp.]